MFQFNTDFFKKMQFYAVSQFRQNPDYTNLCEVIGKDFNDLKKISQYILDCVDIDNASGIWLDYIGWLVGTTREYFNISQFFSVNSADVNVEKYIWFPSQTVGQISDLKDNLFRKRIYAKIGYNISTGTREENIYILKNMTNANHVKIKKVAPMTLDITIIGDAILYTQTLIEDINNALGMGVGIRNLQIVGE